MSTTAIIIIVVVLAVIAAGVVFLLPMLRRRQLRRKFGPEYDRAVEEHGDRRAAERELAERQQRHARYQLRPLATESRYRYEEDWARVQERFVDSPAEAVTEAERLVHNLGTELGYPDEGRERRLADLSVLHGENVGQYRKAHAVTSRADSTTDDLRTALLSYRSLFQELLERGVRITGRDEQSDGEASKAVQKR